MSVLVLAEHNNNKLNEATKKAVTAACQISNPVHIIIAGDGCKNVAKDASYISGVDKVLLADDVMYKNMLGEVTSDLLLDLMGNYKYLVAAATTNGKNILPRVAASMDVSQISEIISVIDGKTFQRPIYAGNAIATVESTTEKNVIIVEHKLGFININAGIDQSNIPQADNIALLLPENPSKSAKAIQTNLSNQLNKNISIIISDSMTRPYRSGVINFALASSNIQSLVNLKGENDMYGNKLKGTEVAVADELASAAGLLMGQSDEKKPIILIKGFNKSTYKVNDAFDLIMNENEDLYR